MHQARLDLGGRERARGRTNALAWGRLWHCRPGESAGAPAPPLRYARRAPVVLFSPLESGQDLNPWLRAAASVFAVLALPGWQGPQPRPSGTLLAGRPRPGSRSEVKATPNTPPARTEPWGPPAPPAPDPHSPDEGLSILRPQHGLTSFVHSDHMGAGGGPGHRVDGRASKGEVGTWVRPQ